MGKQKGQSLIEFALVFPFFLFLILGIIYSGMLFYDYSTLSNIARSAARERAVADSSVQTSTIIGHYFVNNQFSPHIITSLYGPAKQNPFVIQNDASDSDDIVVTITMQLGRRPPIVEVILPEQYSIVYHMRKDYKETSP